MLVLGGVWQKTRAGASGDVLVIIPVLALFVYPENGSNAAEEMSGGWDACGKSCSIADEYDQQSEGCGEGGRS